MKPVHNELFYSRLPVNKIPLTELLMEAHLFYPIPVGWHVVITDVTNSTAAVQEGMHETINLVATGSIVAVLNIVYKANLTVPFFFGGDGATFILPGQVMEEVMTALQQHRQNTQKNFNVTLRVGHVPVAEIYAQQHTLKISKLYTAELFDIPVLLGDGLAYAEQKIKGDDYVLAATAGILPEPDLSGMQCRWDKIKPPQTDHEVISLLVLAKDAKKQARVFMQVMESVDKIYGAPKARTPISIGKLMLKATLAKIGLEMRVRMGGFKPWYLLKNWLRTLLGYFYFKTKKGKGYLLKLVDMSDTLVIDGKINTVISGTARQRELLVTALNKQEKSGEILYGLFVSTESVMSCYVRNMDDSHIHFVDGAEGGYTKAAGVIKQKLRQQIKI